jgi:hypothetical protein
MTRIKKTLLYAGLVLGVYMFVTWLGGCLAHAAEAVPPTEDVSLIARHGFWGGLLLVFGVASKLLQRAEARHWLKERRWLAIVAGGVAVIAAGLNWQLNGGDPEAVTYALSAAIGLVLQPNLTSSGAGSGSP